MQNSIIHNGCENVRIPTDISLSEYIRQLIQDDNIIAFYQSDDWKELRQDVLDECHNECQMCLEDGRYTRADCVHHVNHVRVRPDLALSRTYRDREGKEQRQLIPLCDACHNVMHPEKAFKNQEKERFLNEERW